MPNLINYLDIDDLVRNQAHFLPYEIELDRVIKVYKVPALYAIESLSRTISTKKHQESRYLYPPTHLLKRDVKGFLLLVRSHSPLIEKETIIEIDDLHPSETFIAFKRWNDYTLIYPEEHQPETTLNKEIIPQQVQVFDESQSNSRGLHRIKCEYWVKDKWRKYIKRLHCAYTIEGCISHSCSEHCEEMQVNEKGNVKGLLCRCGD
ncbi:hypothetical protein [Colwellia sp. Arc7-D]|uniref:hypothetical protein n=1 Tax=Colwellia sp. Arc7-D TaxID=2161872 RepID=UPI000D347C51|nr:hypothetical protein [Colwellia sp. Arc7-D]AWB57434.1 hypothetical protein DBO93_07655 [Colwellia sp. Arc7-D]